MERRAGVSYKKIPSGQSTMAKNYILGENGIKKAWRFRQNTYQKKCILGKIQWPKITVGAKCNGESVEVSAKYVPKKMHSGQNTMEKNCIWGKIQWRKG